MRGIFALMFQGFLTHSGRKAACWRPKVKLHVLIALLRPQSQITGVTGAIKPLCHRMDAYHDVVCLGYRRHHYWNRITVAVPADEKSTAKKFANQR